MSMIGAALRSMLCAAGLVAAAFSASQAPAASPADDGQAGSEARGALKGALRLSPEGGDGSPEGERAWEGWHPVLDLHAVFREGGVVLTRSTGGEASHRCSWRLEATSDGAAMTPEAPEVSGARLIRRYGPIEEEFINAEAGLRQVVRREPLAASGVAFRLETDLTAKPADDGRTLLLLSGGEWVLRYRLLEVMDDRDRALDARMEIEGRPGSREVVVRLPDGDLSGIPWSRVVGLWDTPKSGIPEGGVERILAAPSNDLCAGAEVIPAAGPFPYRTATVADITGATTTGDPPAPSCQPDVSRSVWYRFTPGVSADYTFSVCSNGPTNTTVDDTVLAVYRSTPDGDCGGTLVEVPAASPFASCDDDSCVNEDLQSELTVQLEYGSVYFVVAWQFGSAAPTPGDEAIQLRVSRANPLPPPPANDTCEGAETIPGGGPFPHLSAAIDDVSGARTVGDPSSPSCATVVSRSVWYAITPGADANYTFSTCADAPTATTLDDTVVAVYATSDGTCGGDLSEVAGACDDDACGSEALQATVTASLEAGVKYYVVVWQRGTTRPAAGQAAVQLRVTKALPPPPPSNDQCGGAESIPDGPYPRVTALITDVTGATTTGDPGDPSCGGTLRSRSLWYRFAPGQTASYTFSSCSGDGLGTTVGDTVMAVYASGGGSCAGPLTEVSGGCDDDGCAAEEAQSTVTASLQGGTVYYVLVWQKGVGVPGPGDTAVQLRVVKGPPAPANDACAGAETIPDGPYPVMSSVTADITGASTASDPASASCQANRSRGVWYRFSPGTSGYYRICTCAGEGALTTVQDTVLALYTSPAGCAGPFTEAATTLCVDACDDDSCASGDTQSAVTTYLEGGKTYYGVVWKFGSDPPAPGMTAVQLSVDRLPQTTPPANDDCASAATIPPAGPFPYSAALAPDVTAASCAGDPPAPSCEPATSRSVWYRLTPDRPGLFTFSTCSDAPTGCTADDTVIGLYHAPSGCGGPFTEVGCDDDGCVSGPLQAVVGEIPLDVGETYYAVVWSFGTQPPAAGDTAVQVRVDADFTPWNDRCEAAVALELDVPVSGTTAAANDSYRLAESACFTGVGQNPTTAPGLDVTYAFTAPDDDEYSFRITGHAVGLPHDAALYLSEACEAGAPPVIVASCLAAANRNTGGSSEEISCLPLAAGETVWITVDNADAAGPGSDFTMEVNRCVRESEPNDAPASASPAACGVEGSISPVADVDFHALGEPLAGSRLFAVVDGVAANPSNSDFDLRVTDSSSTLEYDDANNDAEFGNASPNVGGTRATGAGLFLRLTQKSSAAQAEPYRLYAVTQASAGGATAENEPNDALGSAQAADYVLGTLPAPSPSTDVDLYRIEATGGDLWVIGLDGDPGYDGTPLNAKLEVLDAAGAVLLTVNDGGSTGNSRTPAAGLTATSPVAPAEGLTFRVPEAGSYFVRVSAGSAGANTSGDYLLSLSPGCLAADADQDAIPNVTDCAREAPGNDPPGPVHLLALHRGPAGVLTLSWESQDPVAGPATVYDVSRGDLAALRASGFPAGAVCATSALPDTPYAEPDSGCALAPGAGCWYLVRARNGCGAGTFAATGQAGAHPLDGPSGPCP